MRHFRPPGLAGAFAIPSCVGIRFNVGKLLERIYQNAAQFDLASARYSHVEHIRHSLAYPFYHCAPPVQVIVAGENGMGMDMTNLSERANVASLLWSNGISCDYTLQSGLMMSMLTMFSCDSSITRPACEWNVEMICGLCAVFKIPFVVVVAPHLLSSKNTVKLRATTVKTPTGEQFNHSGSDELVLLQSLPSVLLERIRSDENKAPESTMHESNSSSDLQLLSQQRQNQNIDVDCTYVATDQYYDDEHKIKSDNAQWKNVKKVIKTSTQKMTSHLNQLYNPMHGTAQNIPVIAIELPFNVVRDMGSHLMLNGLASLNSPEIGSKYPQYKKVFRTLMYALDNQCQKSKAFAKGGVPDTSGSSHGLTLPIFLYSIPCDKYDLVTLSMT